MIFYHCIIDAVKVSGENANVYMRFTCIIIIYLCILFNFNLNFSANFTNSNTIFLSNLNTDFISSTELITSECVGVINRKVSNTRNLILFITAI